MIETVENAPAGGREPAAAGQLDAMDELRHRAAMELHDGVLQTLTAAGLQLAVARGLVHTDPGAAERVLATLAESLVAEQREIRLYVDEMRDGWSPHRNGSPALDVRLDDLARRIARIWGVSIDAESHLHEAVPPELDGQVLRLVQEAAVNAIRHGSAREVGVTVDVADEEVVITVTDDGGGFPFLGVYDHEALREQRLGPVSLKQRAEAAGGRVAIDSARTGATVTVRLPLASPEAR